MDIRQVTVKVLSQQGEKTLVDDHGLHYELYGLDDIAIGETVKIELKLNKRTNKWTVKKVLREIDHDRGY